MAKVGLKNPGATAFGESGLFNPTTAAVAKLSAQIAFSNGTVTEPAGWNNYAANGNGGSVNNGLSMSLTSPAGKSTGWTITLDTMTGPGAGGTTTGNNSGVYPDAVMSLYWYNTTSTSNLSITGLVAGRAYNLTVFGSRAAAGRNTVYTVAGQAINLLVSNNTSQTANFTNVSADTSGTIKLAWTCASGQTYGYINALVIAEA